VDVIFDESNGSQVEQVDKNIIDEEEPPSLSIMRMGLGEVRPHEVQAQTPIEERNNAPSSSTRVEPPSSQQPQDQSQVHGDDQVHGLIKRENQVEKLKKMLHKLKMTMMDPFNLNHKCRIQEFIKVFNEIIPLTIFLEVFKDG
jgi:hypothetical protein